jgi:hypothetical protein
MEEYIEEDFEDEEEVNNFFEMRNLPAAAVSIVLTHDFVLADSLINLMARSLFGNLITSNEQNHELLCPKYLTTFGTVWFSYGFICLQCVYYSMSQPTQNHESIQLKKNRKHKNKQTNKQTNKPTKAVRMKATRVFL